MYILVELLSNQVYISFILVKTSQKFEEVPITTTNVLKEGRIWLQHTAFPHPRWANRLLCPWQIQEATMGT